MLALGALTGVATGVLAWLLITGVHLVTQFAWADPVPAWQLVLVPTLGGLAVGVLTTYLVPEVAGGGVVTTMESLALRGGRLRRRTPFAATVATALALGTGSSGGREGPIVLIGGAVGSAVGRIPPLDEERNRSLVAAGAAAGIAATFNAPIGGMLFAIELLLGGIRRAGSLQVVVIAAVAGSVTARQLVGEDLPLFDASANLGLRAPSELLLYAGLGLAAVVVAVGFRRGEDLSRRAFTAVRQLIGGPLTVALAGLVVGVIALAVPEVLGEGSDLPAIDGERDPIQAMLDVELGVDWSVAAFLLVLLVGKLVATLVSVGAGSAVGTFAPTLFTGAALGGAFGIAASRLLGIPAVDVGAYALVGMAAVFAATARAPLTAVVIVFELTGSYDLVLPLMLAVGIGMFATELAGWESIYTHQLRRRGVIYGQPDDLDVLQTVTVGEVMHRESDSTVPESLPVEAFAEQLRRTGGHGAVVVGDDGHLVGVVTRSDLNHAGATVGEICTRQVLTATPDDPVFRAVRRMASRDVSRLPVIDHATRRVVGELRRSDVVRAYQRGIARSLGSQQRREVGKLRDLAGVRFVELVVDADSPLAGARVSDVDWPARTTLTSIRRSGEVVVPTGGTRIEAGDELITLTADGDAVRSLASPAE